MTCLPADPAPDQWHWYFDELGGHDCTCSAYKVYRGDELMFNIDTIEFINELTATWEEKTAPNPRAEALARAICQRMQGL